MKTFFHSGDVGDVLMSCASIRTVGGGELYIGNRPWTRPMVPRMGLLQRLLDTQGYIEKFTVHSGQHIDYDFSTFRQGGHEFGQTLAGLQARHVNINPNLTEPWLNVRPSIYTKGKIVVARTPRYPNDYFPWKKIVQELGKHVYFIGLFSEYVQFCRQFGRVAYLPTNDFYDVAAAIAGSELYIGNQCGPTAVCEALKHRMVQEVCLAIPDCIYPRANAIFCTDGGMYLEVCGQKFLSEPFIIPFTPNLQETPPGGWRIKHNGISVAHYDATTAMMNYRQECRDKEMLAPENLKDIMIRQSYVDTPPPEKLAVIRRVEALFA